jgi:hypothetical protein
LLINGPFHGTDRGPSPSPHGPAQFPDVEIVVTMPAVGDEVLYHSDDRWVPAEVTASRTNGNLMLLHEDGTAVAQHGAHIHGWLTYAEAVEYHREHASA